MHINPAPAENRCCGQRCAHNRCVNAGPCADCSAGNVIVVIPTVSTSSAGRGVYLSNANKRSGHCNRCGNGNATNNCWDVTIHWTDGGVSQNVMFAIGSLSHHSTRTGSIANNMTGTTTATATNLSGGLDTHGNSAGSRILRICFTNPAVEIQLIGQVIPPPRTPCATHTWGTDFTPHTNGTQHIRSCTVPHCTGRDNVNCTYSGAFSGNANGTTHGRECSGNGCNNRESVNCTFTGTHTTNNNGTHGRTCTANGCNNRQTANCAPNPGTCSTCGFNATAAGAVVSAVGNNLGWGTPIAVNVTFTINTAAGHSNGQRWTMTITVPAGTALHAGESAEANALHGGTGWRRHWDGTANLDMRIVGTTLTLTGTRTGPYNTTVVMTNPTLLTLARFS
jgi:hypothetical protein